MMVGVVLQFNKFQPLTYNVMLVLLSFIISWGEVWFFDLRMIPLERKAREIWGDYQVKVSSKFFRTQYSEMKLSEARGKLKFEKNN